MEHLEICLKFLAGSARAKMAHTYFGFCIMPVFERGLALPLVSHVISD